MTKNKNYDIIFIETRKGEKILVVKARCVSNDVNTWLIGVIGTAIGTKSEDNVMFYPDNSDPVYRAVVPWRNLEPIEERNDNCA